MLFSINHIAGSIVARGKAGRCVTAATENVCLAISEEPFASSVQSAIEEINDNINDCTENAQVSDKMKSRMLEAT